MRKGIDNQSKNYCGIVMILYFIRFFSISFFLHILFHSQYSLSQNIAKSYLNNLDNTQEQYETEFQKRSQYLLDCIEENGGSTPAGYKDCGAYEDYGKYLHGKIAAVFSKGVGSQYYHLAENWMDIHRNCRQFHFNFFGLANILCANHKEPSIQRNLKNYLESVMTRTDSYNAFTGEGTENHLHMSRTSGYLFCQLANKYFPEDSMRWQTNPKMKIARKWILDWSKKIYEVGTGEFASTIYYIYDISPWLNLYDFAEDTIVKSAAKAVLDYYASEVALLYMQGNIGGVDLRGRGHSSKSFESSIGILGWLWYGDSPINEDSTICDIYFSGKTKLHLNVAFGCLSTYRPPMLAVDLANNTFPIPSMYYNSKPAYLLDNPSYIKSTFYRDKQFVLGAGYLPYGGWTSGCYSTIGWKLLARGNINKTKSYQYISGQGMLKKSLGEQWRSPFDQLIHHKNVIFQLTKVPTIIDSLKQNAYQTIEEWDSVWCKQFYKRFPNDEKDSPIGKYMTENEKNKSYLYFQTNGGNFNFFTKKSVVFVELDSIFVAIRAIQNITPVWYDSTTLEDGGILFDKLCGFLLEIGNKCDYKNLKSFSRKYLSISKLDTSLLQKDSLIYVSMQKDTFRIKYNEFGTYTEPIFDWGLGDSIDVNNIKNPYAYQPTNDNLYTIRKWDVGKGSGRIATWSINNKLVDLNKNWAVYEGPGFYIKNSELHLLNAGKEYIVNYSSDYPIFYKR